MQGYFVDKVIKMVPRNEDAYFWTLESGDDDLWIEYTYWELEDGTPVRKGNVSINTDMVDLFVKGLFELRDHIVEETARFEKET